MLRGKVEDLQRRLDAGSSGQAPPVRPQGREGRAKDGGDDEKRSARKRRREAPQRGRGTASMSMVSAISSDDGKRSGSIDRPANRRAPYPPRRKVSRPRQPEPRQNVPPRRAEPRLVPRQDTPPPPRPKDPAGPSRPAQNTQVAAPPRRGSGNADKKLSTGRTAAVELGKKAQHEERTGTELGKALAEQRAKSRAAAAATSHSADQAGHQFASTSEAGARSDQRA